MAIKIEAVANPISSFDPTVAATRVLRQFQMGAICPAEMWAQLADVLTQGDVGQVLDSLPVELQNEVRQSLDERPISFEVLKGHPLYSQIESWCRSS